MSKYFNETQTKLETELLEAVGVEQFLETIKEVPVPAAVMAHSRLEECRAVKLLTRASPLLISRLDNFNHAAAESYRGLRTRLMRLKSASDFRSVVVTSAVQGDGKTLTSANLAISLSQLPQCRTLVMDSDLRTGGLTDLLKLPKGPGLTEVLKGSSSYTQAVCSTDFPNLYVLGTGSPVSSPLELLAAPAFKEFIKWASESFSVIVVDSPPLASVTDCELVTSVCDATLIVVRALHTSRELLDSTVSQIDAKKILGFVYNDAEQTSRYGVYPYSARAK